MLRPERARAEHEPALSPRSSVDPARDPRHDARRRHRPRGARRRDARLRRARRARPALPPGLRHRARDAALARLDDDGPLPGRPRRPRERALPRARLARSPPSGCSRRATAPRRSCRASSSRAASASRAASTLYDDELPGGLRRAAARRRRPTRALALPQRAQVAAAAPACGCTTTTRTSPTRRPSPSGAGIARDAVPRRGGRDGRRARRARARRSSSAAPGPAAILVVGDHGEGLGEHGEAQHGKLALPGDDARAAGCWSAPACSPGVERRAGQHAARLRHPPRLGGLGRPPAACARRKPRSCWARR